jgi:TRAP transporter 4TM/12TM fusion protein
MKELPMALFKNYKAEHAAKKAALERGDIDISSLDSELATARNIEENKHTLYGKIAIATAFLMCAFHIYTGIFGLLDAISQRGFHMAFAITILLLTQPLSKKAFKGKFQSNKPVALVMGIFDILMIVGVWAAVYISRVEYLGKSAKAGEVTIWATYAGGILLFIVLEATRRSLGNIMPTLAIIFLAYALAGPYLPYEIAHRGYSFGRIFEFLSTNADGLFGTTLSVSATVIFMFVAFGAFLEASGCSDFINNMAISMTGRIKSGPALSAVVASAIMGTINGSAVANVVGTGTFTIPLMKSRGYKSEFAGGVESVASTGGQILPPIMGSGAFLMVAFTEVNYLTIAASAVIPAVLYFIGCAAAVVAQAEIAEIERTPEEDIPKTWAVFKDGYFYLIIIGILLYLLIIAAMSPLRSALYATLSIPVVMLVDKKKRYTFKQIPSSMAKAGFNSMSVVLGCACAGIVVAMVALTGIGVVFGDMMIKLSGGNVFLSLLYTAMACIILGMGLPTTAAYVIAASILGPALTKVGIPLLNAHLFIFYFACLSAITPPVALAAYAGAGIAKCNPMTTAIEACKIGFAGFVVPFIFAYNPAMLLQGSFLEILGITVTALVGVVAMSFAFQGWYIVNIGMLPRLILLTTGLGMVVPGVVTDFTGIGGVAIVTLYALAKKKKLNSGAAA